MIIIRILNIRHTIRIITLPSLAILISACQSIGVVNLTEPVTPDVIEQPQPLVLIDGVTVAQSPINIAIPVPDIEDIPVLAPDNDELDSFSLTNNMSIEQEAATELAHIGTGYTPLEFG